MNPTSSASTTLLDLSRLPALPQTLIELIEACNNSDMDIYTIGAMVARDATISARILQLANSAFLGTKAAFVEIEQAVIYLGIDTVQNLAVSVSVHEAFNSGKHHAGINMPQFWYHSLLTAILAKTLAEATNYARPAEAYLGGLLHDLGKLLLASSFPEKYASVLSQQPEPEQLAGLEQKHLGICHNEASAMLVRHWHIQEAIADAIELHHAALTVDSPSLSLGEIISLANSLSLAPPALHDYSAYPVQEPLNGAVLERFCIQATDIVEDIAQAIGITVERDIETQRSKKTEEAAEGLRRTVESVTAIFGALDNLLKAKDRKRICQVIEETLQILFDVRHSFFLLPTEPSGRNRVHVSLTNPLQPHLAEIPLQEEETSSIIQRCRAESVICHTSKHDASNPMCLEDSRLVAFLGCEALLAVPVPITESDRGVLVAGLSHATLQQLEPNIESLRLLAAQAGARLQLEHITRKRAADLVRKELEAVEKVARSIAHEISNPLAIIQNYLAVLERKITAHDDTTYRIQLICDEIERINGIARQLENISDPTSARPVKTVRLDHLLKDVLTFFRESVFQHRKIEVSIRLQPDTRSLPVPAETMRQVLTILFTNAADALPDGGQIVVNSSLEPEDDTAQHILRLSVSDNGPGVEPDMTRSIFNAGITTKDDGHLGLGLSIARKLLVDRGGTISYEQSATRGACFVVHFPLEI